MLDLKMKPLTYLLHGVFFLNLPISVTPAPWCGCPDVIMASSEKTNTTRTFIANLFSAVALDNFGASFSSALSDDLTWTVTGSSPIAGVYHSKSEYVSQVGIPRARRRPREICASGLASLNLY